MVRSVFNFYIPYTYSYVSLPDILYVWWGEGIEGGGEERSEKNAMYYVLHVIQNRNLTVDNEVKTPDQVVEKSDRFEDT